MKHDPENGNPRATPQVVKNINFTTNNFYSEFTNNPPVTATAAALPQLQGAGLVRDLREAMSLGTAQSQALEQTLTSFKAATTAQARQALLSNVVTAWANTSAMGDAMARNPLSGTSLLAGSPTGYISSPAHAIAAFAQSQPALYAQLTTLERFNGQPVIERYVRATNSAYYDPVQARWLGYTYYSVSIEPQRLPFFQSAYDSLKESTYQSLYLQTAGQELLSQVELIIDDKGLRLDFAAVDAVFAQKVAANPAQAAVELAEFVRFTQHSLLGSGWDGAVQLAGLKGRNAPQPQKLSVKSATSPGRICARSYRKRSKFGDALTSRSGIRRSPTAMRRVPSFSQRQRRFSAKRLQLCYEYRARPRAVAHDRRGSEQQRHEIKGVD